VSNFAFTNHIFSAIAINRRRKKYYSKLSKGKSDFLSFILNFYSFILIPISFFSDIYAKKFQRKGVNILTDDFIEMIEINLKTKKLGKSNVLKEQNFIFLNIKRICYLKKVKKLVKIKKLDEISALTNNFIKDIEEIEIKDNCNIPMTKHLAESIGFMSLHGIEYSRLSNGKTLNFSLFLIKLHLLGLLTSLKAIDLRAQKLFEDGVGIIINDIPSIPFTKEFEEIYQLANVSISQCVN